MENTYIISGIPAGTYGVGRLLSYLKNTRLTLISPKEFKNKNRYIRQFMNICARILFYFGIYFLKNKSIILIHPQTIGFSLCKKIIKNNDVTLYIMDNSFFCSRSYNSLYGQECIKCLYGDLQNIQKYECRSFPVRYSMQSNKDFLLFIREYSSKIKFYVQNNSQERLLRECFSEVNVYIKVVGLVTVDMISSGNESVTVNTKTHSMFDVVYHGSDEEAKGILYVIDLAEKMSGHRFFVPYDKDSIKRKFGISCNLSNVTFQSMSWETGLYELVVNAKIILCPSMWSAPIEGAVVKSLQFNGAVGVIKNKYGFNNDIPDNVIIKLDGDLNVDVATLHNVLIDDMFLKYLKFRSKNWITTFLSVNKKLFDEIFLIDVKNAKE